MRKSYLKGNIMKFENRHANTNRAFDDNIDATLANVYAASDNESAKANVENLKILVEAKQTFNQSRTDMILKGIAVGGTLLSIGLICAFEQDSVITTKALGFIPKPKI